MYKTIYIEVIILIKSGRLLIIKGSSDVSTTMSIFISLPNFKSLCVLLIFLNAGVRQKNRFLIKMSLMCMGLYVPALY